MIELNKAYCMDYKDFMQLFIDNSVELILTDLPYARKYLPLYVELARRAKRVLRVGGSLVTMCPNYMLPEVLSGMSLFLKYRWLTAIDYWYGAHARMAMGIEVCWKPVVWFVNEKLSPNRFITDMIRAGKRDKHLHKWQQDLAFGLYFIERLTNEGDLVVDPFVGSGTIPLAAEMLKRKWLACDIDPKAIEITQKRLKDYRDGL